MLQILFQNFMLGKKKNKAQLKNLIILYIVHFDILNVENRDQRLFNQEPKSI
jgi:hypothetical protein